jgi:hypothetical protein
MAKRKDSVALFEVITATRKKQEAAATGTGTSVLRTPKWWFKSRDKSVSGRDVVPGEFGPAALPPASTTPAPQLIAPAEPSLTASSAVVQRVAAPERVTIPSGVTSVDPFGLDGPEHAPAVRETWLSRVRTAMPWGGGKKVDVDSDRREVTIRFRYTTAIVAGFAVCVIIGLAYLTGRRNNDRAAGANGISSAAIKAGPVLPDVLKIGPDSKPPEDHDDIADPPAPPAGGKTGDASKAGVKPPVPPVPARPAANPNLPGAADGVETVLPRIKGLNYVVIQSYPEEKNALEAQRALAADGIPCTIESGLKGWTADDWHSIVGTHGFARIKDAPAYQRYLRAVEAVSKKYAGSSKSKRFEPMAYKWK